MNKQNILRRKYAAIAASKKTKEEKPPSVFVLEPDYKNLICSHAYLGKKGYTILKEYLNPEDEAFLRKDLFVKPATTSAYGADTSGDAYPVFRENDKKMYLPRFYGIARYGLPSKTEIEGGKDVHFVFPKPLRDYQDKIIGVYTKHVDAGICKNSPIQGGGGILEVPCGRGKCLGKNTPILMYDGSIKPVQDIAIGDVIMGDDSTPRNVLSIARGRETMYKVIENNGPGYVVNESHILSLKNSQNGSVIDMSVLDYLQLPKYYRERGGAFHGFRVPIVFSETHVDMGPYVVGRSLGNGGDHIPQPYKCNARKVQLSVLAGIIDSIATVTNRPLDYYEIIHPSESFANDVVYLARSLGYPTNLRKKTKPGRPPGTPPRFIIKIYATGCEIPVKIAHVLKPPAKKHSNLYYKIKLEKMDEDDYFGFEIDGNRRFVLGDFTVTHNTVMSLKIISLLHKKTLILVHKEFLMNQWIERIHEFLPGAKIGKIQGPLAEIEGNDIVIGMIQSIYNKEFPGNMYSSFGLTIIDEVHRIGSEEFSKTLLKIATPYMLGISATVERKDKLTKVLYMFIGPKIYSEKREDDDVVQVRAIQYLTNDADFNEVEYDFRGNPKYSTMITKLCAFGPRSDFIVRAIGDLVLENPANQIMVLCHNRSLLRYLHDSIVHKKIAPVGFYVGGMKQADLQATESMQIVLATYAMAAEALDIKTLSTLVMITPKTDITQSVGRILRMKHENPIIVDIVDSHDIFQNQWRHRKTFYKKCNYRIQQTDSRKYANMVDTPWSVVFQPCSVAAPISAPGEEESDEVGVNTAKIGTCLINCIDLAE
uniref:Helicase ATP-binding domain-containing protein n=1 Tax=viral metagenome TaxID=1070528 RepID=A0A6C0D4J0_9ZZZZ